MISKEYGLFESLVGSAVVYDEKNCISKTKRLLPKLRNPKLFECDTDFFLMFECDGKLVVRVRGTDGRTLKKWVSAWKANAKRNTDINGYAEGFNIGAEFVMKSIERTLYIGNYSRVVIDGHSRGGAVGQRAGIMISNKYSIPVDVVAWASPPIGNYRTQSIYKDLHDSGKINIQKVINPGDPVTSLFRNNPDKEKRGVDLGEGITLPPDTRMQKLFRWIPFLLHEHSPKEYMDGLAKYKGWTNRSDKRFIRSLKKMMVN